MGTLILSQTHITPHTTPHTTPHHTSFSGVSGPVSSPDCKLDLSPATPTVSTTDHSQTELTGPVIFLLDISLLASAEMLILFFLNFKSLDPKKNFYLIIGW